MSKDSLALICYDGSDDAKNAILKAGPLLAPRPAFVLTAWETASLALSLGSAGAGPIPDIEPFLEAQRERAETIADQGVVLAGHAGFQAKALIIHASGPIWPEVVDAAEEHGADVIVLGSRGLGGIRSMLLGSVSNGIVHHATRPTLVVRSTDA